MALGYIYHPGGVIAELVANRNWEIEIACQCHPAKASRQPFLDPTRKQIPTDVRLIPLMSDGSRSPLHYE